MTDTVFNCYVVRIIYQPEFFPPQYSVQVYLGDPDNGGAVVGLPVTIEDTGGPLAFGARLIQLLAALPPCP